MKRVNWICLGIGIYPYNRQIRCDIPETLQERGWRRETSLSPPVKVFLTDRSKAVLISWTIFVIHASCLSCFRVCSLQHCGHLLGKGRPLGFLVCDVFLCFVTFPCGVLGQAWCLVVSNTDFCLFLTFIAPPIFRALSIMLYYGWTGDTLWAQLLLQFY